MNRIALLSVSLVSLIALSCKKKTETVNVPIPDGYFIKASVDGEQKEDRGNVGEATTFMHNQVDRYSGGNKRVWYFSTVSPGGHNPSFEFSFGAVQIPDGNDADQMDDIFTTGEQVLEIPEDSVYEVIYYGPDKYAYTRQFSDAAITCTVSDVSAPFTKNKKSTVAVSGVIDSIRLFEFDRDLQEFTGNHIDVKNLTFKLPFQSDSEL